MVSVGAIAGTVCGVGGEEDAVGGVGGKVSKQEKRGFRSRKQTTKAVYIYRSEVIRAV